jgi:hypothetical protein
MCWVHKREGEGKSMIEEYRETPGEKETGRLEAFSDGVC